MMAAFYLYVFGQELRCIWEFVTDYASERSSCRFPKLEECAHFHYERVQLGALNVRLVDDKSELLNSSIASQSIGGDIANGQNAAHNASGATGGPGSFRAFSPTSCWFIIKVIPHIADAFMVKRSFENMQMFDEMLHRCVYDRKISGLCNLQDLEVKSEEDVEYAVSKYLERFSKIASDSLTCGTILTWLQLDNKGRRLPLADGDTMRTINTPAVGAAYGVRRYMAQASDEISIEVGDMISVIDMPSPAESIWWRGKKSHLQKSHYEVGFFPQSCVATIGDKIPRHFPMPAPLVGQLDVSPTKPVLRKHGKLIAFFRSFILSRPSRRRLKQSGIYRERVFSCDLSEHLLNSGQEIPMVLKCCAEFLEEYGVVDGIYRLSGITSNIQRLRRAFDEERIPDLGNPEMKQDIHAVSSLLKMYFRELPNPLCTYQLYDNFVEAIQGKADCTADERLRLMKETVLKLPPPHYRTLKYLATHLNKISQHHARTGMTDKNLAIVWAPNLLRSPALESGGVAALRGVGVQAVVTEYLIRNCHNIFDALDDSNTRLSYIATAGAAPPHELRMDSLTDCESLLVEQREHDQLLTFVERPKSLGASGPKLLSLEEAQERISRLDNCDMNKSMPINMVATNAANISSYIEVGGGPSSLPDKYHTVLPVPRSWQKRKTHSWKSLFTRNQRSSNCAGHEHKTALSPADIVSGAATHKEPSQVTFAPSNVIMVASADSRTHPKSLLKLHEKTKSTEHFDISHAGGDSIKPMDICVRSNSIDSLRTAGHSRSVSHDSYFDLLQSPQRGHMTTCPSRELSELGLNFDREEPEMRIFSESESLVSSPRVGKENIPPPASTAASRRILRARPEEYSSQTNSVNPSPKKQPRLNLLLSPHAAGASSSSQAQQNWTPQAVAGECQEHAHLSSDESCCKRYKLEDQLSDIQYIDCGTPEHGMAAQPQTLYTSVQIHNPPKSALCRSSNYSSTSSESAAGKLLDRELTAAPAKPARSCNVKTGLQDLGGGDAPLISSGSSSGRKLTRYSYPTVQLGGKRKEQEGAAVKERFSYPGSSRLLPNNAEPMEHDELKQRVPARFGCVEQAARTVTFSPQQTSAVQHQLPKPVPELLRPKNRYSYCDTSDASMHQRHSALAQQQLELLNKASSKEHLIPELHEAQLPAHQSPLHSPRYSLLVGDTSSENSSALNTPQYELDPLMGSSAISGLSALSGNSSLANQQQLQHLLAVDCNSSLGGGSSRESLGLNGLNGTVKERRDMHALKRELSLDLKSSNANANLCVEHAERTATLPARMQLQHQLIPSPNNSNFTDNTSQSVTPSEYGYQYLQRQSSMHSLLETTENSPTYEDYENTPSNLQSPEQDASSRLASPIKSTISITFNCKSPKEEAANTLTTNTPRRSQKAPLLETSFDEHTVYEQVKIFRNSVTEVNQLLEEEQKKYAQLPGLQEEELSLLENKSIASESLKSENLICLSDEDEQEVQSFDVDMGIQHPLDSLDVFDADKVDGSLLYENVELRKPKSVYQNINSEDMKTGLLHSVTEHDDASEKLELDSLDSIKTCESSKSEQLLALEVTRADSPTEGRSPSSFSVKQLANKFESSPVEQHSAFDFNFRSSMKKRAGPVVPEPKPSKPPAQPTNANANVNASANAAAKVKEQLTNTQQITRSLDENAFVREFGTKHIYDLTTKSTQQLPEYNSNNVAAADLANRRKSFDFTRPKTLNPPKRLPGMSITEEVYNSKTCSNATLDKSPTTTQPAQRLDMLKETNSNTTHAQDFETTELKITPALQLHGNNTTHTQQADLSNSNTSLASLNSLKVLSGVKLDRERIDRIKEERRQQLTQKYGGAENFKSRSKTDLNASSLKDEELQFQLESMRVKSKSRGDMRTLQKDMDNLKEFGRTTAGSGAEMTAGSAVGRGGSETALHQQRVRSVSDERNQNCDVGLTNAKTRVGHYNGGSQVSSDSGSGSGSDDSSRRLLPTDAQQHEQEFSARATVQKFERKSLDYANGSLVGSGTVREGARERSNYAMQANAGGGAAGAGGATAAATAGVTTSGIVNSSRGNMSATREKISPQFSIRDVTAMFESRAQNQQ